jgi:hypothetical protein
MDMWYTAMGLYKTIKHKNNSDSNPKLRSETNAPWYVSNFTLHSDLQIPFVIEEIHRLSTLRHNNRLVAEISNPPNIRSLRETMAVCPTTTHR